MKETSLKGAHKNLSVQKFGGSSLTSTVHIRLIAEKVASRRLAGQPVILVVSAFKEETNRLLGLCRSFAPSLSRRESDLVASTGEQVTAGLMAMALNQLGIPARSFLGHQVQIQTDSNFTDARIKRIKIAALSASLSRGEVPVVAGFQGVNREGSITTLGRGGSDTTAVAIAAAMGAERCELFKDVDGVYTTDPTHFPSAKRLTRLSYSQMLELTYLGAKVLHPESVSLAQKHKVSLCVRGSFGEGLGTQIESDEDATETFALTGQERQNISIPRDPISQISVVTHRSYSQNQMEATMKNILQEIKVPVFQTFHSRLSTTCVIPSGLQLMALHALHDGIEIGNSRSPITLEGR